MGLTVPGMGKQAIVDMIYPVGSIYMSTVNITPAAVFGGEWEAIRGRFLLAESDAHAAGSTGGEETHTLTAAEAPDHTHTLAVGQGGGAASFPAWGFPGAIGGPSNSFRANYSLTGYTGAEPRATTPHNNMPPYLAVYVWKRIA